MPIVRDRDGVFQADVYFWDSAANKRIRKQVSTGIKADGSRQAKRNAERVARDIESSYVDGSARRTRGATLAKAIEKRYDAQRLAGASASSVQITEQKLLNVVRHFGASCDVSAISEADLIAYASQARQSRAPATVTRELVELCCAMRAAGIDPPKAPDLGPGGVKELWFNSADSAALISQLPERWRDYAIVYRLAGLRLSELYRLEPAHVNITPGHVRVRGTKTAGADRTVPMHPQVAEILARRAGRGDPGSEISARRAASGPLFPDIWPAGNGNRDLTSAARRAGLKFEGRVSFNILRASFCTELVLAGVPLKKVAYLMGHKTTAMVERVYTRFFGSEIGADTVHKLAPLEISALTSGRNGAQTPIPGADVRNAIVTAEQEPAHAKHAVLLENQD